MSRKFNEKWEEKPRGIKGIVRRSEPLKPRIEHALRRVELQNQKINDHISRYERRDKEIFSRIVDAQENNQSEKVRVLANELAELRKQKGILMHSNLSLQNITLRLRTIYDFGNTVSAVTPVSAVLGKIRTGISEMLPEVGRELFEVESSLSDISIDMSGSLNTPYDFGMQGEDARMILKEAAAVAENRAKESLPDLSIEGYKESSPIARKNTDY